MKSPSTLDLIHQIQRGGWILSIKDSPGIELNEAFSKRYRIPEEYYMFLSHVKSCISPDDKSWFLCENDFNERSESAFKWNEFELLGLEATEDDPPLAAKILEFWDSCLPILLSVTNGYRYDGLLTQGEGSGKIVRGDEPEFEVTEVVAENFRDFLAKLAAGLLIL